MKRLLYLLPLAGLAAGCGKAPSGGGRPKGEFPVAAVVAPVRQEPLAETLRLVGSLEAIDRVDISAEMEARIVEIGFTDGQRVAKGDMLFRLDDVRPKALVAEAKARFQLAQTDFDRSRKLFENQTVAQEVLDQAAAGLEMARAALEISERQLADTVLVAPFDGTLAERRFSRGQLVTRGQTLCTLVQTAPIRAVFNVPERFTSQLSTNLTINLTSAAWPDRTFPGKVDYLAPIVDPASRTVRVHARLENEDGQLKPGMFAGLNLVFKMREQALLVPESAVFFRGDQTLLVVRNAEGKAEFTPVTVGIRAGGNVEITSGVSAGQQVVAEGFQKMGPGSTILISPESKRYGLEPSPPPAAPGAPAAAAPDAKPDAAPAETKPEAPAPEAAPKS